jgi:hypothetical protein
MDAAQLEQLTAAPMSEHAYMRSLRSLLQPSMWANDPVLGGVQDEDAMAAFINRDSLGAGATAEKWGSSPAGWPQQFEGKQRMRIDGRPTSQWPRLEAGHSDDLQN